MINSTQISQLNQPVTAGGIRHVICDQNRSNTPIGIKLAAIRNVTLSMSCSNYPTLALLMIKKKRNQTWRGRKKKMKNRKRKRRKIKLPFHLKTSLIPRSYLSGAPPSFHLLHQYGANFCLSGFFIPLAEDEILAV